MITRLPRSLALAVATMAMVLPFIGVSGQMPVRAPRYAITNAKIVTAAGPAIDKGTVVMRDGVIEDVGAAVTAPADALDRRRHRARGLSRPDRHVQHRAGRSQDAAAAGAARGPAQGGRGRGAAVATPDSITWADQEREARDAFPASGRRRGGAGRVEGDDLRRLAAAGITSALAVPSQGIIRGQSALVNVTAPPDPARPARSRPIVAASSSCGRRSRSTSSLRPAGRRRR